MVNVSSKTYIHNKNLKHVCNFRVLWTQVSNPISKNQIRLTQEGLFPEPQAFKGSALIPTPCPVPPHGVRGWSHLCHSAETWKSFPGPTLALPWLILWRIGLTKELIRVHTVHKDPAGDRKIQRWTHPNAQNPWIHYFTWQGRFWNGEIVLVYAISTT